jgi:hypothetical protein
MIGLPEETKPSRRATDDTSQITATGHTIPRFAFIVQRSMRMELRAPGRAES